MTTETATPLANAQYELLQIAENLVSGKKEVGSLSTAQFKLLQAAEKIYNQGKADASEWKKGLATSVGPLKTAELAPLNLGYLEEQIKDLKGRVDELSRKKAVSASPAASTVAPETVEALATGTHEALKVLAQQLDYLTDLTTNLPYCVISEVINRWGYFPKSQVLVVLFHSGKRFAYKNVPQNIAKGFRVAESAGEYYNAMIKNNYVAEEVVEKGAFDSKGTVYANHVTHALRPSKAALEKVGASKA